MGLEELSRKAIFDFEVGDEFHYEYRYRELAMRFHGLFREGWIKLSVRTKDESIAGVVTYTMTEEKHYAEEAFDPFINEGWTTTSHNIKDLVVTYDKLEQRPYPEYLPNIAIGSGIFLDKDVLEIGWNDHEQRWEYIYKRGSNFDLYIDDGNGCFSFNPIPEFTYYQSTFVPGLGLTSSTDSEPGRWGSGTVSQQLVYNEKGATQWGKPVGVAEAQKQPGLQFYPNPSKGAITVFNLPIGSRSWTLSSLRGQLVEQGFLPSATESEHMNFSNHLAGIYLLQVQTSKGIIHEKLVLSPSE